MATTYAELQTEIADFLNRDDLTSVIPTFIRLAEAQVNRRIRHWRMEQRATGTITDSRFSLPSDWLGTISLTLTGSGTSPLELISRMDMAKRRDVSNDTGGTPAFYTHEGGYIHFYPSPSDDMELEILYHEKIPALTDSATSNWLLENHPDVYLYGSLLQSAPYLKDDERVNIWASLFSAGIDAVNNSSETERYSGSGLRMRIKTYG